MRAHSIMNMLHTDTEWCAISGKRAAFVRTCWSLKEHKIQVKNQKSGLSKTNRQTNTYKKKQRNAKVGAVKARILIRPIAPHRKIVHSHRNAISALHPTRSFCFERIFPLQPLHLALTALVVSTPECLWFLLKDNPLISVAKSGILSTGWCNYSK